MARQKQFTEEELRERKNAKARKTYQANKERRAAYHAERNRDLMQDPDHREKMRLKTAAWRAANPDKVKAMNAARRAANPELARQQSREWFAQNPDKRAAYEQNRRAKKRATGGKLSPNIKQKLYKLQRGTCPCCRSHFRSEEMHLDHVMPLARGGEHTDDNMQLLCQPCNQSKYSKHPVEFMQQRGFLL